MTAKAKAPGRTKRAARGQPILERSDIRMILFDLANKLAPDDVEELISREQELRAKAVQLTESHLPLFRHQLELALDCLHDHVAGTCSQIPYYTISLLAAGVCYFADELDVIPDFLPRVGRLDDAAVMAMASQLAEDGLRRYCEATGRPVELPFGARPRPRRSRQ